MSPREQLTKANAIETVLLACARTSRVLRMPACATDGVRTKGSAIAEAYGQSAA